MIITSSGFWTDCHSKRWVLVLKCLRTTDLFYKVVVNIDERSKALYKGRNNGVDVITWHSPLCNTAAF